MKRVSMPLVCEVPAKAGGGRQESAQALLRPRTSIRARKHDDLAKRSTGTVWLVLLGTFESRCAYNPLFQASKVPLAPCPIA